MNVFCSVSYLKEKFGRRHGVSATIENRGACLPAGIRYRRKFVRKSNTEAN